MNFAFIEKYLAGFDELNIIMQTSYRTSGGDFQQVLDDLTTCLETAYRAGYDAVEEMLEISGLETDSTRLYQAIFKEIDGKTVSERVQQHLQNKDLSALETLAQSEYHRVFNQALADGARDAAAVISSGDSSANMSDGAKTGKLSTGITKTWKTVGDEKVRDTHQYLEGVQIPLEEEFFTFDGDHADQPGNFARAENNANCRCILLLSRQGSL